MKRFEKIKSIVEKYDAKIATIDNAIEDAYSELMANWHILSNRNRCRTYYDALLVRAKRLNYCLEKWLDKLNFYYDEVLLAEIEEDLYIRSSIIPAEAMPKFTLWLLEMNAELRGEE